MGIRLAERDGYNLPLHRHQPDVAELHRVAVILKQDRPGRTRVARQARGGHVHDLFLAVLIPLGDADRVVDFRPVEDDADDPRLRWLAVLAHRRLEVDVVGLPDGGRLARIDGWLRNLVDPAAIALLELVRRDAVAIEHLHLVTALQVDAAVAPALPAALGLIGHAKLDVQLEPAI